MHVRESLLDLLNHSVPVMRGDTSSESWPLRVNTGVKLGFGYDFGRASRFEGTITSGAVAGFRYFGIVCEPHSVFRETSHLLEDAHYLLSLQIGGSKRVHQRGKSALVREGEFVLYDSTSPVVLDVRKGYRSINLAFPAGHLSSADREVLQSSVGNAIPLHEGIGPVFGASLLGLQQCEDDASGSFDELHRNLIEMMVVMMKPRETPGSAPTGGGVTLETVTRHIREHLGDSSLSVESVATANYVSLRTVHNLFADTGVTPAAWIRQQRIRRAMELLAETRSRRSVTEVAQLCGFSTIAQFSHTFKQATGMTPTEYRLEMGETAQRG